MLHVAPDRKDFLYKNKAMEIGLEVCGWECEVCECVRFVAGNVRFMSVSGL